MSLYYCSQCQQAFLPERTITDGESLFCKKCEVQLINLGSENGQVSLQAHLEAQQISSAKNLYHDYSLIKSKHYQEPKKDPILFECEAKLKENPLDVMTLFTLSKWYYAKGLVNESLAIVRQIIKIEPNFLPAHDFLSQQNSSPSSTDLPENIGTLEDMGINYFNSNNFKEAEVIFKKILKLNAKHPAAQRYLADIYTKNNDFESAIHILNRLTLQFPEDAMILFNLAVACFNASDYNRARSNLKAAKKLTRDQGLLSEINQFLTHLMQFE